MDTIILLSDDAVVQLLNYVDLGKISVKTGISESTLKNYRYGRTAISDMPVSTRSKLSNAFLYNEVPDYPVHVSLDENSWDAVIERRKEQSGFVDLQLESLSAWYNVMHADISNFGASNPRYYLIDASEGIVDIGTLLSISLGMGVLCVVRESTCPEEWIQMLYPASTTQGVVRAWMNVERINLFDYPEANSVIGIRNHFAKKIDDIMVLDVIRYFDEHNINTISELFRLVSTDMDDLSLRLVKNELLVQALKTFLRRETQEWAISLEE